tara:strand:+ start:247 stop:783 length:537 start_codon:yes stop_codon:yes gene_type:complete
MSIDYKQLKTLVKEAMFTGGGINEPSAPEGIPHRMPSADTEKPEQHQGDADANNMYEIALAAREAAEILVEALDDPTYDAAYEYAFKASACLRRVLNCLEESGAHPMPNQRVVAKPANQQKYAGGSKRTAGDFAGGSSIGGNFAMGLEEGDVTNTPVTRKARKITIGPDASSVKVGTK